MWNISATSSENYGFKQDNIWFIEVTEDFIMKNIVSSVTD